jgi:hypothetical protein
MIPFTLSDYQLAFMERPIEKIFLEGPAGIARTTTGVGLLLHLLSAGAPARSILLIMSLEY